VSEDPPERPGVARLVEALNVRRNAAVGFGVGVLLAAALVAGVAVGPVGRFPTVYYLALGFVLAVGTGLLLTAVFTLGSAVRRARSL
jgi:predicted tellurium resistance membrane protein TerC